MHTARWIGRCLQLLLLLLLLLLGQARRGQALPSPGPTLHLTLLTWVPDGGRFTVKIAQGVDELVYMLRVAFTTPALAITANHSSRVHAMVALRASDKLAMPGVSEAPGALLRRTRLMAQGLEHYVQAAVVDSDTALVSDWDVASRWKGVLFVGPQSSAWGHFACWRIAQSSLDKLTLEARRDVCDAWVAAADAQWSLQLYDYSVPRDASGGNIAVRAHAKHYDALLLGEARVTTRDGAVTTTHPVVFDLESRRSYLPANLFQPGMKLALTFSGPGDDKDTPLAIDLARTGAALDEEFTINTDSNEIILGLPFLRSRFSAVTYDARTQHLAVTWVDPEPPEGLRILVSLLVVLQGMLVIRWFGGDFGSVVAVTTQASSRGELPMRVHYEVRQLFYEMLTLLFSGAAFALVVPYVGAEIQPYAYVLLTIWALHAATLVIYMALDAQPWAQLRLSVRVASTQVPLPPPHFIARYMLHVFLLGSGVLAGLLLSNDSIYMMLFALMVTLFLIYHLSYTAAAVLACSLGFGRVSDRGQAWFCASTGWSVYALMELTALVAFDVSTYLYIIVPVIDAIDYFTAMAIVQAFAVLLVVGSHTVAVFAVYTEVIDALAARAPRPADKTK
jgi:hypothetical protein